jgi:ribosomal protein L23
VRRGIAASEERGMSNERITTILAAAGLGLGLVFSSAIAQDGNLPAPAQQAAPQEAQDGESNGQATFELLTPIIDLGTILDTEPASGTIRFRNAGNAMLMVPNVGTTCGCTIAELPKNEFEPGESIELEVTFDPRGKTSGRHEQTVTFNTNDRANPRVAVKVRANVKPLVAIEPAQVNLGSVAKHTRKETLISLTGMKEDFEAFYVTLVGDGAKYFDVDILGTDTLEQDGETVSRTDILVSLKEDAPPGRAQAIATIRTNDDRRKIVTVPVGAQVDGDVVINPLRMSLGTLSVGRELEEVIEVRHGRNEPFKITGVELRPLQPTDMQSVKVEYTVEPIDAEAGANGKAVDAYRVKLVMPSIEQAGRIRGNFVVHTTVPLEETVMLPYVGRVVDTRSGE